jgi:broad specificity phosphatase PhoE
MELFLVRHGEFEYKNISKNPGLSKNGRLQAKLLAKRLAKQKFDKIYSSDLLRTQETLGYIKAHHKNTPVIITSGLREICRELNGAKKRPQVTKARLTLEKKTLERTYHKILRENNTKSKILIVAHGNVINYLLAKFLGVTSKRFWKIMIWPTSLTQVETNKKEYIIKLIGNTSHLKEHQFAMQPHLDFDGNHV